ncbi:hypothetical protein [Bacillus sp. JJ722]|uniref:hypothetical protein n=1 Tax=Bacillus sp. JJ722 TaxID=3122973 RepID=UPI002FFEA2E9
MRAKEVFIIYIGDGKVFPSEIQRGALIGNSTVFVLDDEGASLFTCEPTVSDRHVIVDLDNDSYDVLDGNEELILDIMCGTDKWGVRLR